MKKVLAIMAVLSNTFGANCSDDYMERLDARFYELLIINYSLGGATTFETYVGVYNFYIENDYTLEKKCRHLPTVAQVAFCTGRKIIDKYFDEFEARGLEVNVYNIEHEAMRVYEKIEACEK